MSHFPKDAQSSKKDPFSKNVLFSQKWPTFKKCPIFTRPHLRRVRPTILSARRVRRTGSKGPKGLQLDVGARRAPRLLVMHIIKH